jgi:uncharacterized protein (DUF2252 family)
MAELLSPAQRRALGQQRRKHMPRVDHATWDVKLRKESSLKLMEVSMRGRVPSLVTLKYERMAASPFGFFRGAVPVMAYDLSLQDNTGLVCQLCGDAHVRNLGAFAAPDGRLVFDINDFDETIRGPFEWDVKRMATSLVLAGREAGSKDAHCFEAVRMFLETYRTSIVEFARMPVLEMARYQVHRLQGVAAIESVLHLAERATPIHTLMVLTKAASQRAGKPAKKSKEAPKKTDGTPRVFKTIPPVLTRITGAMAEKVIASLEPYAKTLQPERQRFLKQYRPVDVAFKVVGTGSVGLRDYCVYLEGNGPGDPLFLQIKEEVESGYAPYLKARSRMHQGQRVVNGGRAMQLQSDPFLGWTTIDGRQYLVRQLNDHKASIELTQLKAAGLMEYAEVCGELLARGHARSNDSLEIAGYLGNSTRFDDALVKFAEAYANQTDADWKTLVASMKKSSSPQVAARQDSKSEARRLVARRNS